jgi:F0F1-type ATP synthase assembly protein I
MPGPSGRRMGVWAKVAYYSGLGFILPAAAMGGFGLGWLLDRWLHTSPIFALILGVVGAAAGVVDILRVLNRAEAQDDADDRNDGPGES